MVWDVNHLHNKKTIVDSDQLASKKLDDHDLHCFQKLYIHVSGLAWYGVPLCPSNIFVLKMLSAFYVCFICSSAYQTRFYHSLHARIQEFLSGGSRSV